MPSDTAFLGDWSASSTLINEYSALGATVDDSYREPIRMLGGAGRISPRELSSAVRNLRDLGIGVDENNRVLRGLRMGIMTGYSLHMLYAATVAMRRTEMWYETTWAAGETIVMALARQWKLIAKGVSAAAMVYGAFRAGEYFGGKDWHLDEMDLSKPSERRRAERMIRDDLTKMRT